MIHNDPLLESKNMAVQQSEESDQQHQKMLDWVANNRSKYEIREFFVNNAWAVEYRELIKM